ncbi:formimidoylglutamase [Hydrotalea sp.]|uniref:formimidoylglutamase n=1 Tax=Hydrotalea sp. TaxID=2881279 RepID=UPI00258279EC|nr:formimidoylglutamase [Hydrotalea sp.]
MNFESTVEFLEPLPIDAIANEQMYLESHIGGQIDMHIADAPFPNIEEADVVLVGCNDMRGAGIHSHTSGTNAIREAFYQLFYWHKEIKIADLGNVKRGATLSDSYAALKTVVLELMAKGKRVMVIGGSHDQTLALYQAFADAQKIIEAVCVDSVIDLNMDSPAPADHFLIQMLTSEPNYLRHYNHIGFQSYLTHPNMLQTIDKLRFDCVRVGKVKENMEEVEPSIRNAHLFSFDISAIQHAHAPANRLTPNGFTGEEACKLMQFAGMSHTVQAMGIFGYNADNDVHNLTAKQIAHMLWYMMDGMLKSKQEARFEEKEHFNSFHLAFAEFDTVFMQSKKTGRWWMQTFDGKFIPCSKMDYIIACTDEIPERWLRYAERL